MKIDTQKNAEHAEIAELLADCKVVMFTQPGDDVLGIASRPGGERAAQ